MTAVSVSTSNSALASILNTAAIRDPALSWLLTAVSLAVIDAVHRLALCLIHLLTGTLLWRVQEEADRSFSSNKKQEYPTIRLAACQAPLPSLNPLLPPQLRPCNKLTVVLDLDETLCSARAQHAVPAHLLRWGACNFPLTYDLGDGKGHEEVVIFPRPGVRAFLQELSSLAEIIVFTAALPGYARPVLDALDPEGSLFAARLYRQATVRTSRQSYVKDLSRLGRDLRHTVLVDNDPFSGLLQPRNLLPVVPYHGDARDRELITSVLPLLRRLVHAPDVRPVLGDRFGMEQFFLDHGY